MAARGRKRTIDARTPPGPMPPMPDWITDPAAIAIWQQHSDVVHNLGLLESLDAIGFALLCDSIATLMDMRDQFSQDGAYTNSVGENGALQVNPLCQLIAQQVKGVLSLAAEFGMTPRGRVSLTGSLSVNPDAGKINPMEQLLQELTEDNPASVPAAPATATAEPTRKRQAKPKAGPKAKPKAAKRPAKRKPKQK